MTTAPIPATTPLRPRFYDSHPFAQGIDIAYITIRELGYALPFYIAVGASLYFGSPIAYFAAASYLLLILFAHTSPIAALERGEWDEANRMIRCRAAIPVSLVSGMDVLRAADEQRSDILDALIEKGFDLNAEDEEGNTLLHRATSAAQVRLLCRHGAQGLRRNRHQISPLHKAARSWPLDCIEALLQGIRVADNDLTDAFCQALSANRPPDILDLFVHRNPKILQQKGSLLFEQAANCPRAFLYLLGKGATRFQGHRITGAHENVNAAANAAWKISLLAQSALGASQLAREIDALNRLRAQYGLTALPLQWKPPMNEPSPLKQEIAPDLRLLLNKGLKKLSFVQWRSLATWIEKGESPAEKKNRMQQLFRQEGETQQKRKQLIQQLLHPSQHPKHRETAAAVFQRINRLLDENPVVEKFKL